MIYIKLIRWPQLMMMAFSMLLVRNMIIIPRLTEAGLAPATATLEFSLLVLAVLLIAAAGFVTNDLFDRETDSINQPEQMIIGRYIGNNEAIMLIRLLNVLGNLSGFFVAWKLSNWQFALIFPVMTGLLWFYSSRYKRMVLTGNIVISFAVAMVIIIVWLFDFFALRADAVLFSRALPALPAITGLVMAYALFSFLLNFISEIIADILHLPGDTKMGFRTFPAVYGQLPAKNLGIGLVTTLVFMLGFWQLILFKVGLIAALGAMFSITALTIVLLIQLALTHQAKGFKAVLLLLRLINIAGIISIVFL